MKKLLILFVLLLSPALTQAQIPTCKVALAAKPQGPFPCSVTATWVDNSTDETGFLLQRRLNGGAWATIGGPLAANLTSAIDATLQQSITVDNVYDYQVIAVNASGQSAPSNLESFTIPKAASVPKPASSLTITFKGATGELDLTPGKTTKLKNDNGTFIISASEVTIDLK